jgi:hypothetical protein
MQKYLKYANTAPSRMRQLLKDYSQCLDISICAFCTTKEEIATNARINTLKYICAFVALLYPKIILPRRTLKLVTAYFFILILY